MATKTYATENTKTLRPAPNIGIRIIAGTSVIKTFTKDDLISVKLSLRGAETKPEDPDFQASTIEIEAYYPGDTQDFLQYMGREVVIQYKSSYSTNVWTQDSPSKPDDTTESQCVGIRAFYTAFDEDSLQVSDHIIKIKAIDAIGAYQDKGNDYLIMVNSNSWTPTQHTMDGVSRSWYAVEDMMASFVGVWGVSNVYRVGSLPQAYVSATDSKHWALYRPTQSIRKKIASLMNIFRGLGPLPYTLDTELLHKRFIFRDAGSPMRIWYNKMIDTSDTNYTQFKMWRQANLTNKIYHDSWTNPIWDIKYEDVADLTHEYGVPIKSIALDNPYVHRGKLERKDGLLLESSSSQIVTFDGPVRVVSAGVTMTSGTAPTVSTTQLNPTTCVLKTGSFSSSASGTAYINYWPVVMSYLSNPPDRHIDTGLTYGDTIDFNPIYGFRCFDYSCKSDWSASFPKYYEYITNTIKLCYGTNPGLKHPTWINFTWRGHPGMQPRDIIKFTEKDGSQNYYEIESLTLDHENGGLTSTVKAMLIRSVE